MESRLITIATFDHPSEMIVMRGRLESEGIACFVQDELTVQVYHFYSNAVGGVKLQVVSEDVERAREILEETGFLRETPSAPSPFWQKIDALTGRIPLLQRATVQLRLLIMVTLLFTIFVVSLAIWSMPSKTQVLENHFWCLKSFETQGLSVVPQTTSPIRSIVPWCEEGIEFMSDGTVKLPGFRCSTITGLWSLKNGRLWISEVDTLGRVYEGEYEYKISGRQLFMESVHTRVHCEKI